VIRPTVADMPTSPILSLGRTAEGVLASQDVIDLTQGVADWSPPPAVQERLRVIVHEPDAWGYTARAGAPDVRLAIAEDSADLYGAPLTPDHVLVTGGCNQAFCVAVATVAGPGDEVVLFSPFYFNHPSCLRLLGIRPVVQPLLPGGQPCVESLQQAIGSRTRAVVVVTPGNPTGSTISGQALRDLSAMARHHGLLLILDETYRRFAFDDGSRPHDLHSDPDWEGSLVSLLSFSKELAMPGQRVGALLAAPAFVEQAVKVLDAISVCAPRYGQEAVAAGLKASGAWMEERRRLVSNRRESLVDALSSHPGGFSVESAGGFFAWVSHPFQDRSDVEICGRLAEVVGLSVLPGSAFALGETGCIRLSYASLPAERAMLVAERLARFAQRNRRSEAGR